MSTFTSPVSHPSPVQSRTPRIFQLVIQVVILGGATFLAAGTLRWPWAWTYIAIFVLVLAINLLVLPAELIAERGRAKPNVKPWDRKLTAAMLAFTLLLLVVAGLDRRFGWTAPYPTWVHAAALIGWIAGQALVTWSMTANRFFSTMVRIQGDRGHAVASTGPYRYVRHPGYVGISLFTFFIPLVLGSWWALLPALAVVAVLVVRTALEDRTLHAELAGYSDYAQQTRRRLIPGLW